MHAGFGNEWCRPLLGYRHTCIWMGSEDSGRCLHRQQGCAPTAWPCARRGPRTAAHSAGYTCVHTCYGGGRGLVNGIKEFRLRNYCRHTLKWSKILQRFLFYHCSSPPLSVCSQWLGFSLKDTKITHWIRFSWHFFLIYFPCSGLFNTHACSCVCVYLSDEWGLKIWSRIYGDFIRRNFLKSILGQRTMSDVRGGLRFCVYLSSPRECAIK